MSFEGRYQLFSAHWIIDFEIIFEAHYIKLGKTFQSSISFKFKTHLRRLDICLISCK